MLVGEYFHNIDEKGRIIMPSKFKELMGNEFVLTKGLDNCLFVFSMPEWAKLDEKLSALSISGGRATQRFFYGGMTVTSCDKSGRVLIPANLREYASLSQKAVIIGVSRRLEIWSKDSWDKQNESFTQDSHALAEQMEALGI